MTKHINERLDYAKEQKPDDLDHSLYSLDTDDSVLGLYSLDTDDSVHFGATQLDTDLGLYSHDTDDSVHFGATHLDTDSESYPGESQVNAVGDILSAEQVLDEDLQALITEPRVFQDN